MARSADTATSAITEEITRTTKTGNSFKIKLTFKECKITIEKDIRFLKSPASATDAAFNAFKQKVKDAVSKYMNNKFRLRVKGEKCPDCTIPIEVKINEVDTGGYPVTLELGKDGNGSSGTGGSKIQENGPTGCKPEARPLQYTHEAGHFILGQEDEYAGNPAGAPVKEDNSMMGNFHNEGLDKAEFKERQFDFVREWLKGKYPDCEIKLERVP